MDTRVGPVLCSQERENEAKIGGDWNGGDEPIFARSGQGFMPVSGVFGGKGIDFWIGLMHCFQ